MGPCCIYEICVENKMVLDAAGYDKENSAQLAPLGEMEHARLR